MPLAIISCNRRQQENEVHSKIENIINSNIPRLLDAEKILLIPNSGCTGCISYAESFVLENLDKMVNTKIVFTAISSRKVLKSRIGELFNDESIIIDSTNILFKEDLISIYPTLISLVNKEIIKIEYQSPKNPDLLSSMITSKF